MDKSTYVRMNSQPQNPECSRSVWRAQDKRAGYRSVETEYKRGGGLDTMGARVHKWPRMAFQGVISQLRVEIVGNVVRPSGG